MVSASSWCAALDTDMGLMVESEVSPSLLRQFPEKHYGVRTLSAKVTDVIFWPFSDLSSEREDRKDEIPIDDDEMELEEKKVVALRLAALVRLYSHSILTRTDKLLTGRSTCTRESARPRIDPPRNLRPPQIPPPPLLSLLPLRTSPHPPLIPN